MLSIGYVDVLMLSKLIGYVDFLCYGSSFSKKSDQTPGALKFDSKSFNEYHSGIAFFCNPLQKQIFHCKICYFTVRDFSVTGC